MNPSEYKEAFLAESREHLTNLNRCLLILEKTPSDKPAIQEIFRAAHTIKGMSATMGYEPMARLSHDMESALDPVRLGKRPLSAPLVDVLFACLDQMEHWVRELGSADRINEDGLDGLMGRLSAATHGVVSDPVQPAPQERAEPGSDAGEVTWGDGDREVLSQARAGGFSVFQISVELDPACAFKEVRAFMVVRNVNGLGEIIRSEPSPEDIEAGRFGRGFHLIAVSDKPAADFEKSLGTISEIASYKVEPYREMPVLPPNVGRSPSASPPPAERAPGAPSGDRPAVAPTVRVHTSKLDRLMALVQELVIAKIRFEQAALTDGGGPLVEPLSQLHFITSELQSLITEVRLVPVKVIFERFPRMVRDLAKNLGKEIEIEIEGGDIELDRTIVDEMSDPLVHLLRNAVDHGVESPEERRLAGKPACGVLKLSARRERTNVLVSLSDDGRGIDPVFLREKAVQRGLMTPEEAERLTDDEALRLISLPGFSTKSEATSVSGRGVGVDVAKTKVESLGGVFRISSEKGRGTTFALKFPLTLAIVKALLVRVSGEIFAVPVTHVVETVEVGPESRRMVQQQETIMLRDEVVPLYHLRELLELPASTGAFLGGEAAVIIAEVGDSRVGLQVDEILGQSEIALKSLDRFLRNLKGYAGVTILGDGRIALILDLAGLLEDLRKHRYHAGVASS